MTQSNESKPAIFPPFVTVHVIGDSLANGYFDQGETGWASRLVKKLQSVKPYGYYLRNLAILGDTSADMLQRFRADRPFGANDILIFAGGVNDTTCWGNPNAESCLSLSKRLSAWNSMLMEGKRFFSNVLVLQILPVNEAACPCRKDARGNDQYYRNDRIEEYNQHLKTLCEQHSVHWVGFDDVRPGAGWNEYLFDDVHPNEKGHAHISERVYDVVITLDGKQGCEL